MKTTPMIRLIKYSSKIIIFSIWTCLLFSCSNEEIMQSYEPTVEVRYQAGRAMLFRHGEPYFIKGAAGTTYLDKVAAYGGNSIRTWSIHDAERILDEAHELGLTVTLGLDIGRPEWGKDFNYWKFWEVNKKIEELVPVIEKFKDHPALLMWGVGNEVELKGGGKRFLIYHTINKIAKMIKEVDPNHPTMTAVSVPPLRNRIGSFRHIMPHVDILGYNAFDRINTMYDKIYGKKAWNKAYILSEWGPSGHWEITDTEWGSPKELSMQEKVKLMESHWNTLSQDSIYFLGSYAFYWGHKHEATHTWFSMFSQDGHQSDQVNFLKYAWSGRKYENSAPIITSMQIKNEKGLVNDNVYLKSGISYSAIVDSKYSSEDSISYRWELWPEQGYFHEKSQFYYNFEHLITQNNSNEIAFKTPIDEGPYRLFVFIFDKHKNYTSHNIPFYVIKR